MLQSTVSLLSNTSTVWNSQYLKKILRIPEDQLKILNNIPGWKSEVDSRQPSPSLTTVVNKNKDNQQIPPISQIPGSTVSQKDLVVDSKEIEKHPENINRKETEKLTRKQRFPLRKSSSLDSVSIRDTNSSHQILKRSSSSSNIREKAITFWNTSADTPSFSIRKRATLTEKSALSNIEEVEEMQVDMDHHTFEKSHFSNSGVQCKMSQELDVSQAIAAKPHTPSNFSAKRETLKLLNVPTNKTYEGEKLVVTLNLSENEKNRFVDAVVNEKSKIDLMNVDESYISQSVPCAQLPSENIHPGKELVVNQEESASASKNYFSSTSKDMQSSLDKTGPHHLGKRKRKTRLEKSKKHRGINADKVKIEYSSEQIKNMIELMKILHKY